MTATPKSTPRDAASLVLLKVGRDGYKVLLGRRPDTARFMPGVYVFPGGAVEDGDAAVALELECPTLAWTALRETWEETGLLLERPDQSSFVASDNALAAYRDRGSLPDTEELHYIARAITPAGLPIRFDTRFFLADGSRVSGKIHASEELPDVAWIPVADAMASDLVRGVTKFALGEAMVLIREPERMQSPNRAVKRYDYDGDVRLITREPQADGLRLDG